MALINIKKVASSEVGKGAVGNFLGNLLTDGTRSIGVLLAVVGVVVVPILLLFFKKSILTQDQVEELCERVRTKRKKLLTGEQFRWDQALLSDAEYLRRNWLNRKLNARLCEQIRARNDLPKLLDTIAEVSFVFGASEFWSRWNSWCNAGNDVAKPAVGIDTRAEVTEPEYEVKSKAVLVTKIVNRFSAWRNRFKPSCNHLFVKWIGANDTALVAGVLRGFANDLSQGEVHVWLARGTLTDANAESLERAFSAENDGVTIERSSGRDDGYDVVISTHFWQHHSVNVVNHEKRELRKDGLFVLLAAIARDPKDDEYVCEGCMPMRAMVADSRKPADDDEITFRPMGVFTDRQSVISYRPIAKFAEHTPVLAWGFPKSVIVDKSVICDDCRLSGWVRDYFQWGKETEAAEYLRESGDGMIPQPSVTVKDIRILARSRAVDPKDTTSEYLLMELEYSVAERQDSARLPIIVCVGYEKNEWRFETSSDRTPITFHPAIEINPATLRKGRNGLLELVLIDAGQDQILRRYGPYIPNSPCADSDMCCVWRIHTRIHEVDLNDLLVFEDSRNGRRAFYSYFPKRRYLTPRGYERGLQMLDRYKSWTKELRGTGNAYCDSLLRFDSVTWLWSYQHLKAFCKKWNLQIDNPPQDLYFHKSFCALTDEDAVKAKLFLGCDPSTPLTETNLLFDSACSVAKDDAFNNLQVEERVKMLACLNVHNVLLFARNCDGDRIVAENV